MPTSLELRARVEDRLADLSPLGRRVALVLLDEHDRLGFYSASEIGRMAGTTDATVIRTVQQLGYRGMVDLKSSVAARLLPPNATQRLSEAIAVDADVGDQMKSLLSTQSHALERLARAEVQAAIRDASEVISGGHHVLVHAHGVSVGIAAHSADQLSRIGLDARQLGSASGLTGDDLRKVSESDVVLVIASGRQPPWHAVLYDRCAEVGAHVVLITDSQPSPSPDATVIRAGRGDAAGLASHVSTIAVIECILLTLATLDPELAEAAMADLLRQRRRLARVHDV